MTNVHTQRIRFLLLHLTTLAAIASLSGCALFGTPKNLSARESVVNAATAQIGVPYTYGGDDRTGFDSSGLTFFAYKQAGFLIPRYPEGQLRAGQLIRFADVKPGDLLIYRVKEHDRDGGTRLHVGLYLGAGDMVHASLDRSVVAVESVDNDYWFRRMVAVVKILP